MRWMAEYGPETRASICAFLADGESLATICRMEGMPAWSTVYAWLDNEPDFAEQVTRAREAGYQVRADRAIADAKSAEDAALGRLAFDAERWYLGKLSIAFADKQKHEHTGKDGAPIEHTVDAKREVEELFGGK
jgi:hypothetical protein